MDDLLVTARFRVLALKAQVEKAKGGKGKGAAQPRHPAGTPLGGQWVGGGIKAALANLFSSAGFSGFGAKTVADPNWGVKQGPPAHTLAHKGSVKHPAKDDKGRDVYIHKPKTGSPPGKWGGPNTLVTVTPGQATPKSLNGVPFAPVAAPADWTKVWGQNAAIEKDLPDLAGHKFKYAAAGVVVTEADGRVWLTSPTNNFGGYRNTFPKGTQEPGLTLQQTAIKEAWEETGLKIEITGVLGDFERTTSVARYYTARRTGGDPASQGWESQALRLAPKSAMRSLLNVPVDRDILRLILDEEDLTKHRPIIIIDEVASIPEDVWHRIGKLLEAAHKAKGPGTGGKGDKAGHWQNQPRWPSGTPLGGQWKAYDGEGLPTPPVIGSSANPGHQLKAQAAYDAVKAGNIDQAVLLLKPMELKLHEKGLYSSGSYAKASNSQQKWSQQAHQYVADLIATNGMKTAAVAKVETLSGPPPLSSYKKIGAKPGGSNPGGIYEKDGVKYLVKGANHPSDDRAKNEVLASKLMQAAGIGAPDMHLVDLQGQYGGGLGVAAKMEAMTPWSKNSLGDLDKARSEFAVHAWLANYDAVGLPAGDNLAMKDGAVFNYDPGGALLYRAQGLPKSFPGGAMPHTVSEWDGMRNKSINAPAASVYGGMTGTQLTEAAKKLQAVDDKTIANLVHAYGPGDATAKIKLVTALKARRDDILAKAGLIAAPAAVTAPKAPAAPQQASTAANGGLPPKLAAEAAAATAAAQAKIDADKASGAAVPAGQVFYQADLTNTEPGHNKFYKITVTKVALGFVVTAQWGKIGTEGQSMVKGSYGSQVAAVTAAKMLANEKKAKGYIGHEQTSALVPKVTTAPEVPALAGAAIAGKKAGFQHAYGIAMGDYGKNNTIVLASEQAVGLMDKAAANGNVAQIDSHIAAAKSLLDSVPIGGSQYDLLSAVAAYGEALNAGMPKTPKAVGPFGGKDPAGILKEALAVTEVAAGSTLGIWAAQAASAMHDGNAIGLAGALNAMHIIATSNYAADSGKVAAQTLIDHFVKEANASGIVSLNGFVAPGTGAKQGGMTALNFNDLTPSPIPSWKGIKGGINAINALSAARVQAKMAFKTADVDKLQAAFDKATDVANGFKIGTKGRLNSNLTRAWIVENAKKAGLIVEGGQFKAADGTKLTSSTQDAIHQQAAVMLDRQGLTPDSLIGKKVIVGLQALESKDDHGLAAIIGGLALDGSPAAIVLSEKLTEMAEAKGGFPMATGSAATIIVDTGGPSAPTPEPSKPATPAMPPFQETTGTAVNYYQGVASKMAEAYQAGDMAKLQALANKKPGSQAMTGGSKVWPTFKSGTKAGQPKGINAELMSKFHQQLVVQLTDHQSAGVQAKLAADVFAPSPGENVGSLPAMPRFDKQKIATTNTNAPSHNAKIDQIAKLAEKGDVKGLLGLKFGTNTYGKKQAALANDALAAMGSPFKVDPGQKKNSHPALTGAVTHAAAEAKAALTDKELPPKVDFLNWNGQGKGLSSSAHANQSNQAAFDQLTALAKAGDFDAIKNFKFQPINKDTGAPVGSPLPISSHPSQHVKNHADYLLQVMDEKLNPPKPLEIFEAKKAAASIAALSSKFPPKPLGSTSKKMPSSQTIGHYIAVGQVSGHDHLIPAKQHNYTPGQVQQAKDDYHKWSGDTAAQKFRSRVQGHGGHEYHPGWDDPNKPVGGYNSSITGAQLMVEAKAAHKWARKQPAGTKIYKWENLTADMKQKLKTAQPGLIIQNPAPACASKSETSTKGFGSSHRWTYVFTEGAKALNSFASGSHPGEQEVTLLPNSRFLILEHKPAGYGQDYAETKVLLLPPDPALDSDGYTYG
jgi:predicted DNA-binding WGR domain protein/8-oxo-dGTP pyrophosphatase MutT (NUDIX family)